MDKHLTNREAWVDFLAWMQTRKEKGEISAIPKDVQEARYADEGKRRYPLKERRIIALINKYAPDRYKRVEGFLLLEE